jgi:hypothetical protein
MTGKEAKTRTREKESPVKVCQKTRRSAGLSANQPASRAFLAGISAMLATGRLEARRSL